MLPRSALVTLRICLAAILLATAGCGGNLQPVRGKVTLPDGSPAAGSLVVVESEIDGKTISARGDVQTDGTYELSTYQPGDGVPPGKYRVLVAPPPVANIDAPTRPPFHAKYSSFQTSGLEFEVKAHEKNEFPIHVTK
jgi:hypothetical protein